MIAKPIAPPFKAMPGPDDDGDVPARGDPTVGQQVAEGADRARADLDGERRGDQPG